MAGKKPRRRNELANINPALVPSAAFAAVPRTPAPEPVPVEGLGGSQEILHSSLVGRQSVPDPGPNDEPFSDPESSLYDYQVMEEAGYSSVEMLAVSKKRRSLSDRDPAVMPGTSQMREHDVEEHQQARMIEALQSQEIHNNPEALYSVPLKRSERAQSSSQSLRSTQAVREAMQQVHDLSSDEEMRTPHGMRGRRPPRKRAVRQKDRQPSARSLHFPVEHETTAKEIVLHSSPSPRAQLSARREPGMVEEIIEQQIIEQVSMASQQTSARSHEDPVSARSRTSVKSVNISEDQIRSLEAEKQHLTTLTHQLETEVQSYREVVSTYESGDSETAQSLLVKKQISDLKEENGSLKNSIKRLNIELSAYQAKYRPVDADQKGGGVRGLPSEGPVPSWLNLPDDLFNDHPIINELNIRYLNPLFLAYDDRLREREETIRKCQNDLELLHQRAQEVVKENDRLRNQSGHGALAPSDVTEWEQMRENAKLVLEENQNLLEQISVKDQKAHDLHQAHVKEVSKLTKQMVLVKAEKSEIEQEVEELRQSHRDLKQKYDKLVLESQGHVTQEQHIREISELKQKISEQEESHKQELDSLNIKLQASQIERQSVTSQMVEMSAENKRYQSEIRVMHKSVRKAQQKMMFLQRAIEQSENKEISVQDYLASVIKLAEKHAFERDTYEKVAREHEVETKKAMKKLLYGNMTVGKMEEKLKLYKMKAAARISTVAERLKEQEELFNSQKKEYEREISHLRMLVREKEEQLQNISRDKRNVEEELESMWQAANSENLRIREEIQNNVTKLRTHKGLSDALDEHDRIEGIYVSSDDEMGKK